MLRREQFAGHQPAADINFMRRPTIVPVACSAAFAAPIPEPPMPDLTSCL
jgi:hypothetical protein